MMMRPRKFHFVRVPVRVFLMLAVMALLALLPLVSVHLCVGTAFFRHTAASQLSSVFDSTWQIGEVRLAADPRVLEIFGASLQDPQGNEAVRVRSIRATVDWPALLANEFRVERVDLEGVDAHLLWDDRGRFGLGDAFSTGPGRERPEVEPPSSFAVVIDKVYVTDAHIVLTFPDFNLEFNDVRVEHFKLEVADQLNMSAELLSVPSGTGTFTPELFGFSSVALPGDNPGDPPIPGKAKLVTPIKDMSATGWTWTGNSFVVDKLKFGAGEAKFIAYGGFMDFEHEDGFSWGAHLTIELPPHFPAVEYFSGPLYGSPLELKLAASGFLSRELNSGSFSDISLDLEATDLEIMGLTFDKAKLSGQLVNRRLYLTHLDVDGYGGEILLVPGATGPLPRWESTRPEPSRVPGRAFVNLLDLHYYMPLRIQGLDIRQLLDEAVAVIPENVLTALTGELDAELTASGRLIDREDGVRFATMPAYHHVKLSQLVLERPTHIARSPSGIVPARRVSLATELMYTSGRITMAAPLRLKLDTDAVVVSGFEMDVTSDDSPISAHVAATTSDVGRYLAAANVEGIQGKVAASFDIEGPLLNPTISNGSLKVDNPQVAGLSATDLVVRFSLANGWLGFTNVQTRGEFGALGARGRVRLFGDKLNEPLADPRLDLKVSAKAVDLAVLNEMLGLGVPMSGLVSLSDGVVTGSVRRPFVSGTVDAGQVEIFGESLESVRGAVLVRQGDLRVEGLEILHSSGADLRVDAHWLRSGELGGRLELGGAHLERIRAARDAGVAGHVRHLDLAFGGSLHLSHLVSTGKRTRAGGRTTTGADIVRWISTQPIDLKGGVAVWNVKVGSHNLGHVTANWYTLDRSTYTGGAEEADDQECEGNRVLLLSGSWLPEVSAEGQRLLVDVGAQRASLGPSQAKPTVREAYPAYVDLDLCVPMDRDQTYVTARATFDHLNVRGIIAEVLSGGLEAERAGRQSGAETEVSGIQVSKLWKFRDRLNQSKTTRVRRQRRADVNDGALAETLALWGATYVGGSVEVELDRTDMRYVAEANLKDLVVSGLGRTVRNTGDVLLVFDGRRFAVDTLTLGTGKDRVVELSGAVTFGNPDLPVEERTRLVTLFVKGDVDLGLLNFFPLSFTDVRGVATADLTLTGPWDGVQIGGEVALAENEEDRLAFGLRGLGQEVEVEGGVVLINSRGVWIKKDNPLKIKIFDGTAIVSGELELDNYKPGSVTVNVRTDHMSYRIPATASLTFNSDLVISLGDLDDPATWLLSGDLDVVEGRIYRDYFGIRESTLSRIFAAGGVSHAQRYQASLLEKAPFLKKVRFDVNVRGRDSLLVQNIIEPFEVDIELRTNLNLRNTLEDPKLYGTLGVLPGSRIHYRGAEFAINTGDLLWEGAVTNPEINLFTETEVVNACAETATADSEAEFGAVGSDVGQMQIYAIALTIEGKLEENIRWELSSSPYADQHDIYALLALGCLADGLDSSADGAVTEIVLRGVLQNIEERIKGISGVDEVRLNTDLDVYRIRLAEHITNRWILGGQAAFGGEANEHRGYLRFLFSDEVFAEASEKTDQSGQFGVDLKLRWLVPLE